MAHSNIVYYYYFQAKLLATQQERDMALAKIRKQEDELQNLRVYYRCVSLILFLETRIGHYRATLYYIFDMICTLSVKFSWWGPEFPRQF